MSRALQALRRVDRLPEVVHCARHSRHWLALTAAYLGLVPVSYPYEFRTRANDVLILESFHDLVTAWVVFCRPEYPVDAGARVIVDVGANIGAFTLYAARQAPGARFVSIEPFPDTAARLRDTVQRNALGHRVRCIELALGPYNHERTIDLSVPGPSQSRNLQTTSDKGTRIECVSLATFFEREALDRIDMLKMDIEGEEHELLLGAPPELLRRITTLALEYHPNGSRSRLFAALGAGGFDLVHDHPAGENSGVAMFRQRGTASAS